MGSRLRVSLECWPYSVGRKAQQDMGSILGEYATLMQLSKIRDSILSTSGYYTLIIFPFRDLVLEEIEIQTSSEFLHQGQDLHKLEILMHKFHLVLTPVGRTMYEQWCPY